MKKIAMGVALCVLACGGKKKDGGGGGDDNDLPPELAKFTPPDAAKVLQGAWQTRISFYKEKDSQIDTLAALEITGDKAKAWDGAKEHALDFSITSPCSWQLVESFDGGMTARYDKFMLIANGKLVAVGDGAAGYRKGKEAIVCQIGTDHLVTMDASGACKSWSLRMMAKTWEQKPIECKWTTKDGKDVLVTGSGDWHHELVADGDLLMADQLRDEVKNERFMKKANDYAAAKAWVEAELKKKDAK